MDMARTLIGNFKGPEGPRGEIGPQGEQGEQGPQGPPGENPLKGVNANLLSLHKDDWFVGGVNSTTGKRQTYATSLTTDYFVDIEPGEDYTLTLESNHTSSTRLNWYQFTDGVYPGASGWSGSYPQNFTFTATGNNLMVRVYFGVEVTKNDLEQVYVKLEKGNQKTPYHDVLVGMDRKIKHHTETPDSLMVCSPSRQLVGGTETALLYYGVEHSNLVNPGDNEEIILSEGLWSFDWVYTMRNHTDGENCTTRVILNEDTIVRAVNEGNVVNSISTKILANEGDTLKLTQLVPTGSSFEIHRGAQNYSRMVLYKIGGSLNV